MMWRSSWAGQLLPVQRISAVSFSRTAGASCVEAYDALGGLKPFGELFQRIDAGWEKQNIFFS